MDREAWRATVHRVAKSPMQLNIHTQWISWTFGTHLICKWRQSDFFLTNLDAFDFFLLAELPLLEPPIQCQIETARVDILTLLQMLRESIQSFTISSWFYDVSSWFFHRYSLCG